VAVEYVNLKECRTLFSAANEIHLELTGERKGAYEGLDGVFEGIWGALEDYPEWPVLLLDEIDHIQQDSNYDPSDFFYRLLRGEGKLKRDLALSVWSISNELLEVDLRLDSRVQSAMSGEEVFFPPYGRDELAQILAPRVDHAFRDGALPGEVFDHGVREAARRWGDARKALWLFRRASETATKRDLIAVTVECIDAALEGTEWEAVREKLLALPLNHFFVLASIVGRDDHATGEIVQPVTTGEVHDIVSSDAFPADLQLGERVLREVLTDLETMGLVESWIDSRDRNGRVKYIETAFDPRWVREAQAAVASGLIPLLPMERFLRVPAHLTPPVCSRDRDSESIRTSPRSVDVLTVGA
jgi:Cdc6-like AAA superfamily ATPase